MALPALYQAKPDAIVAPKGLVGLLELAGFSVMAFDGQLSTAAALRKRRFRRGILFTPSFSTALLLRLGGVEQRRGTNTDNRGPLLTEKVEQQLLAHTHRASVYWLLATGEMPTARPVPALAVPADVRAEFLRLLPAHEPPRRIGIFPGSNAPARRWQPERFAELVQRLQGAAQLIIFGGPDERTLTKQVAGDVALDLGGRTTLPVLAAGLASCDLVISNDSGQLHLAAAVGTPTISLWGAGDPARTGPPSGHVVLRDRRLPCLECVKNQCPRSGQGYILPSAYMECMQLISIDDVLASVQA
jgi:lipopolysaccharide heptosyltransferase II